MSILRKKQMIEAQMDIVLKDRATIFSYQENERLYSEKWRSHNARIMSNTKKMIRLRAEWREINKIKVDSTTAIR